MTDAVVVGEDVDRHEEGGASLPIRIFWGRFLRRIRGKASGNPPQIPCLSARLGLGAEAALKVGGHLPMRALVPWGIQGF